MRASWLVLILAKILELVLGDAVCHYNDTEFSVTGHGQRTTDILSRRRRLVFPKGSTFVLTISILQPIPVHLPSNWNLDFEFDMIWPIPINQAPVPKKKPVAKRKYFTKRPWTMKRPWPQKRRWTLKRLHRRELYANFETALDSRNLPGRQCVLRAICEAKMILSPPGESFIEDAIRLILSNVEDVEDTDLYDIAYRTEVPCHVAYPCPVSFLRLVLYNLYSDSLS